MQTVVGKVPSKQREPACLLCLQKSCLQDYRGKAGEACASGSEVSGCEMHSGQLWAHHEKGRRERSSPMGSAAKDASNSEAPA